jgi:hypothetical protein
LDDREEAEEAGEEKVAGLLALVGDGDGGFAEDEGDDLGRGQGGVEEGEELKVRKAADAGREGT